MLFAAVMGPYYVYEILLTSSLLVLSFICHQKQVEDSTKLKCKPTTLIYIQSMLVLSTVIEMSSGVKYPLCE